MAKNVAAQASEIFQQAINTSKKRVSIINSQTNWGSAKTFKYDKSINEDMIERAAKESTSFTLAFNRDNYDAMLKSGFAGENPNIDAKKIDNISSKIYEMNKDKLKDYSKVDFQNYAYTRFGSKLHGLDENNLGSIDDINGQIGDLTSRFKKEFKSLKDRGVKQLTREDKYVAPIVRGLELHKAGFTEEANKSLAIGVGRLATHPASVTAAGVGVGGAYLKKKSDEKRGNAYYGY